MNVRWFLEEFKQAHSYVVDPHAWESQIRTADTKKYAGRPGMFQLEQDLVVHPALYQKVRDQLDQRSRDTSDLFVAFGGPHIYVSELAVTFPPEGGWTDVIVPERPRLRP